MENIDSLKQNLTGRPRYKLHNCNLFVSPGGIHFIDYLDPVEKISPEIDTSQLTEDQIRYIENTLESNEEKFDSQVTTVASHMSVQGASFLDIGCGGGLFLSKIRDLGGSPVGIELNDSRANYANQYHGLPIHKIPIESPHWTNDHSQFFDAISLWDVIEHVNFPVSTLESAVATLKPKGYLFIDTPCRDSFYHRFGELSYKLSGGKFPTFLNTMYSSVMFGHKQIFSSDEMRALLQDIELEHVAIEKFHELSFPSSYYLKKIVKLDLLVTLTLPVAHLFLKLFPIKNKMLVVARKSG